MEKELFHENLAALNQAFPGAVFISLRQAARYVRKDIRTLQADETFPIKKLGRGAKACNVPVTQLARWLS